MTKVYISATYTLYKPLNNYAMNLDIIYHNSNNPL